jgi:hypothetical protein
MIIPSQIVETILVGYLLVETRLHELVIIDNLVANYSS